jgi:hypothetical protein
VLTNKIYGGTIMSVYENMPICDLRNINNVSDLKEIEKIKNVAILITPKDSSNEIMGAIASIAKENVAMTFSLSNDAVVSMINGISDLQDSDFCTDRETVIFANGVIIIKTLSADVKGSIIANGTVLLHESLKEFCNISFISINGMKAYADFDDYKAYAREVVIDAEYISYLNPKTAVVAARSIRMKNDITVDMLKEKLIKLVAGREIICSKNIASYVTANSICGRGINTDEQIEDKE